jgi:carbon-monoxide dehydrogenase large subunit
MELPQADVTFEHGEFAGINTNKKMTFAEVALAAYVAHKFPTNEIEPGLKETSFYDPTNFTFPAGCHICEVEIDPEIGSVEIVKFTAVDDFGTVINPMIVEGQVHGGIAQGVGQAVHEHGIYDRETGQLLTGSYMDYSMPRADDLPDFDVGLTVTPCPSNPLGVKGCGEAGAIAAPAAVINAITDALGVKEFDMPATPEKIWRVLNRVPERR